MTIDITNIKDLKVVRLNKFNDLRGSFVKVLNEDFFLENGLETNFKESYFSISQKNVIRGMHFQIPPCEHTKLVYVNHGKILDVVLDIRINSATYGKYFAIELDAENPAVVYIPIGFAHGFLSLKDNTMVTYLQTTVYNPLCDAGILFHSFGFDWPVTNPIISVRDKDFPKFENFSTPF